MVRTVRVPPSANLLQSLIDYCRAEGIADAFVLTGMGSLVNVTVANAASVERPPRVQVTEFSGPYEILGLSGYIRIRGDESDAHLHMVGSLSDGQCRGGGLRDATAFLGAVVALVEAKS